MTTTTTTEPAFSQAALRAALSIEARPPRPSALAASVCFAWRAMLKIKHVPMQLFDVTAFRSCSCCSNTYLFAGRWPGRRGSTSSSSCPGSWS